MNFRKPRIHKDSLLQIATFTLTITVMVTTFTSPAQATDTAEAFDSYVKRMIPLSHDFARVRAGLLERHLFLNQLSLAQQELVAVSVLTRESRSNAERLIKNVPVSATPVCPGRKEIFEGLSTYAELDRKLREAMSRLEYYAILRSGLEQACSAGFESLELSENDFTIIKPEINELDGAYVTIGNVGQAIANIFISVINVFTNESERGDIEASYQKYQKQSAHTADLQTYAKAACEQELLEAQNAYSSLDSYALTARDAIAAVRQLPWSKLQGFWNSCLAKDESPTIATAITAAANEILAERATHSSSMNTLKRKIRLRREITKSLARASANPCAPRIVDELKTRQAAAKIIGMEETYLLSISTALERAATSCKGGPQ